MEEIIELVECPVCEVHHADKVDPSGICRECEEKGFFMDPVGTIHLDTEDYDPAVAYI